MICPALQEGHRTEAFDDGVRAWEAFGRAPPDLVILDIGLPRLDGLEVCKRLRSRSDAPIILSRHAKKNSIACSAWKLRRRLPLQAVLDARAHGARQSAASARVVRRISQIRRRSAHRDRRADADPLRLAVRWNGQPVPLTVTEILLLQGRPPTWDRQDARPVDAGGLPGSRVVDDRTIDSHVKRIRRKFQAVDPAFDRIEGVYGAGYRFRDP
jgi:two-component system response regulator ChvI